MKLLWKVGVSLSMLVGSKPAEPDETGDLMARHLGGDPHAFPQLMEPFKADLWGFLRNHVRGRQDAEDLFQEICLKVHRNISSLKDPQKFRSWLFSIALNAVRSFFRKRQLVAVDAPVLEALDQRHLAAGDHPEKALARSETMHHLRVCLQQLPERDRQVLLLEVMGDLPQKDIAEQLDLNLNTVKTILRRARIKLARMMVEMEQGK